MALPLSLPLSLSLSPGAAMAIGEVPARGVQPEAGAAMDRAARVVIGPELSERRVIVSSLSSERLMVRALPQAGATGSRAAPARESSIPLRDVVAIVMEEGGERGAEEVPSLEPVPGGAAPLGVRGGAAEKEARAGWVEMVDGQVLPGSPTVATDGAAGGVVDRVAWSARLWGPVLIDLEGVRSVVVNARAAARVMQGSLERGAASEDRVVLINGDVLDGFVESVSGAAVRIESAGEVRSIELARVAIISLASPARSASGARVWLEDGTVARGALRPAPLGKIGLVPDGPWIERGSESAAGASRESAGAELELSEVGALAFDASRLVALGSLSARVEGVSARRWTPPVVVGPARGVALGAADIELPGPMSAEWMLPPGASHVSMRLELPESARVFGDCVVRVEIAGEEASGVTHRLSSESPSAMVRLALGDALGRAPSAEGVRRLVVRVEAGERGGIQDRVVIRRGLVLVDAPQD